MTRHKIGFYADAGFPAVAIETPDENRTIHSVVKALDCKTVWRIGASGGLFDVKTGKSIDKTMAAMGAIGKIAMEENAALIVLDFQHIIRNAGSYRTLLDTMHMLKARTTSFGMIVLLAPSWKLPPELEHDIPVIKDALPDREELQHALNVNIKSNDLKLDETTRREVLNAASGLTLPEAEGAMALANIQRLDGVKTIDPAIVMEEKMKLVRQSGYLTVTPPAKLSDLGGLGELRSYIDSEVLPCFEDDLMRPRGIMMVGVPGTGKSLAAKVIGAMLGLPVLGCDIAGLKSSGVGDSEAGMKGALQLAEAVAPCVLWFDEIEKGVGGYASSAQSDGGTTLGMVGILLKWSQEHKSKIFMIATCNDHLKLPAELTRAGRFETIFFVDIPQSVEERREIAAVQLEKYAVPTECADIIAEATAGYTGAEIEQLVRSAARRSNRMITAEHVKACTANIKPLSVVRPAEISALREWGNTHLRLANTLPGKIEQGGRRIKAQAQTKESPKLVVNKMLN